MGLASSQARLLNLTARMHDIEYKAQNLEAQKLQMANESRQVYQEYEDALNKQKVQFKQIGADGSANYVNASVATLLEANYRIKILNGGTWYNYTGATPTGKTTTNTDWNAVKNVELKTALTADTDAGTEVEAKDGTKYKLAYDASEGAKSVAIIYTADNKTDEQNELATIDLTNEEVLRNLVEAGFIVFEKPMSDGTFSEVNIATDTSLQEVSDETQLKKAEAKYEADMRKINAKDKKFDTDLAAMEAERNAIKTEMETLKSVARDNVDRTYKLFG